MKLTFEYDQTTGALVGANGYIVTTLMGLESQGVQSDDAGTGIKQLIDLKNAGFETDDIVELRRKGII